MAITRATLGIPATAEEAVAQQRTAQPSGDAEAAPPKGKAPPKPTPQQEQFIVTGAF